jgi:hypothetical protein
VRAIVDVPGGRQDMHGHSDHQQAGRADMRGLKGAVARPKPRADRSPGRQGKKEQREQRQDSRVFVAGSGGLYMLDGHMIDSER